MPNIAALYSLLHGSKVFSNIDLVRGYNQIPMDKESIAKTAVITPFGLFEYLCMPFGLCNATRTFQRFMNELFGHLDFVFIYIDDILIFSKSAVEHMQHLQEVLRILHENGLKIGLEKCNFCKSSLKFLGHTISADGIRPCVKKCEAMEKLEVPETFHELHRFLGAMGFYRKHIPNYAEHEFLL